LRRIRGGGNSDISARMLKGPPVFVARTFYGELAPRFAHPFAVPRPDSCPMVSPKPPKYDRANRWHD